MPPLIPTGALLLATVMHPVSTPVRGAPAHIGRVNGVPTMLVDGRPFLLVGAQCDIWRSTRQDEKTVAFFDGYRDMNATTVSVGIPWSKIEPQEDAYDFRFLDWFVHQAETRGLKLVLNLFNTNVCGKVYEGAGSSIYPAYTPAYILDHPETYHRMVLPYPYRYVEAGPPMCPNDPNTLERERRLVVKVAEHLRDTDARRTVIMLQLDNEFYYQQWEGKRPEYGSAEDLAIRCQCSNCLAKWKAGTFATGEEFMFKSFADYVRELTDAITRVYPLPLYVNSPWWPPRVIPIFLARCPNLALVGIDGVLTPKEPGIFSQSQVGRNIPFAAENPTENAEVRLNLDVLPYYTLIGRHGIGNLLWECGPPQTVVDDPAARRRYGDALYPLKHAQVPIARARGTDRILGWYALRDIRPKLTTDVFGNYVQATPDERPAEKERWFVREGQATRVVDEGTFTAHLGGLSLTVSGSAAGIVVRAGRGELVLALQAGSVSIQGIRDARAERGRFVGDRWVSEGAVALRSEGASTVVEVSAPSVVRLTFRGPS